ncbi:MAG: hypothetical protein KKA65_03060, partial [Nanoarchaeota archaeon]|nr:hypothetical protein [Nanoarchaeota archaeon]
FGKLENKETFVFIKHFKPYFFIKESDLNKAKKVEKFESEKVDLKDFDGKKVVKILVDKPSDVIHVREIFSDANISTYEADIRYAQRFILDNELRSSVDITGDYEYQDDIRVYKDAEIKSSDWKPNLKVLSLDIETNAKTGEIYVVSVATDNVKKSFVNNQKVKGTVFCKDEEEVIEKFVNSIKEIDPDVITGWNLIDFDLKHLQERARKYNFDLMIGRDGSKINLRIVSDFFKNSTADVAGRVVVDALNLIRSSFIKLDDYKLETVAQEFLGKGKLLNFKNIDKYEEINRLYKENPSKLVAYNLLDAELPLEILKESGALDLAIQKSFLTGMNLDKVSASIASLDSLYLPKARKKGLVCNTLHYNVKEKRIMGGFVMESKPGIYDNILVLDFKSLYPSIIKTFNIDPSSFIKSCKGKDLVKAPNGACFRNEEGILPEIISELWLEREKVRKQKNELARYAIKILMNSFFGVLASPNCRFFNMKVANAITHFGQHLNKLTTKIIEKKGYEVIYGDSVKGNRFITLLNPNGLIEIIKIEDFFNKFSQNHFKLRGKDFTSPQGYKALTLNPKTHKSEFKKIKRIIKHKVKKDVYRIIQKFGETEVTSDHSLICWDKGKLRTIKPKEVHKYQMASIMAIPKLKQVKKIDLYDYLKKIQYKIKYKGREKLARVKIDGDYLIFGWTNQNNSIKLKRFVKVGTKEFESLCRLLGAYIGDGSSSTLDTTNSRSGASIANSDKKLLIQLKKDYERLFLNAKVSIILSTKKSRLLKYKTPQGVWKEIIYEDKTMKLQMMNQISAIFFKALAGQKSIAKKLPDFIYHVPEEFQELLLDYLIKTDGSRAVNKKLGYSPVYKQKN